MSVFGENILFETFRSSSWFDLLFLLLACLELHRFTSLHTRYCNIKDKAALGTQPKLESDICILCVHDAMHYLRGTIISIHFAVLSSVSRANNHI